MPVPRYKDGQLAHLEVGLPVESWQSSSSPPWQHWVFSEDQESLAAYLLPRQGG